MKQNQSVGLVKNLAYSIGANGFSMLVSAIVVFLVPRLVGKTDYSYWQLYAFYTSYIGFFHFGWCDGVYLRYGGAYYEQLNYKRLGLQFWMLTGLELFLSAAMLGILGLGGSYSLKTQVLCFTAVNLVLVLPKNYLSFVLQLCGRIQEYSLVTILEKAVYCVMVVVVLALGKTSFVWIVAADVSGKVASLLLSAAYCRELVLCGRAKKPAILDAWQDGRENLKAGVSLLIANLSGMLILGLVRFAVENQWSVEIFGEVSLAVNLSNLLIVFINAIGTVIFPLLKRMNPDKLADTYCLLRDCLMVVLFLCLMVYFPIEMFLSRWLTDYALGISYMAILFPVCVCESKMALVVSPYLKALRKERAMLGSNIITVCLSALLTGITVYLLHSLTLAMLSVLVLFFVRCVICEEILSLALGINVRLEIGKELLMTAVFCGASWFLPRYAFLLYGTAYVLYLLTKRSFLEILRDILKKKSWKNSDTTRE